MFLKETMNINECNNNGGNDNVQLTRQQKQAQLPDHLKCGEVYTWLCEGELYAVECKLCEDRPMCPLSEFPQHMEVWHTDWEESLGEDDINYADYNEDSYDDEDKQFDEVNNDLYLSFTTQDSGLYEEDEPQYELKEDNQHQIERVESEEESLEPFEQVLIEQDNNVDSTQIGEHEDEEKTKEYLNKLTNTTEGKILNDQQHKQDHKLQQLNINNSLKHCKQKERNEELREYESLTTESDTTKHQIKNIRENTNELRDHKQIKTENERDHTNDLEIKYYTESSENLRNSEKKSRKLSPRKKRKINKRGALDSDVIIELGEIPLNKFNTPAEESETQELMENSNLKSSSLSPSNKARISLRHKKSRLTQIFEAKDSDNQNFKILENSETSHDLKEDLIHNLRNSNDSKENQTNKEATAFKIQKRKTGVSKVKDKLNDNYENVCDLEKTLFNNDIENLENSKTIEEVLVNKRNPLKRVRKSKMRDFSQEIKEKCDKEVVETINENESMCNLEKKSANLKGSNKSTKSNINSEKPSLRTKKRKTSTENLSDLEKSLFNNESENMCDLQESTEKNLASNVNESQNFIKININRRNLSLKATATSDLNKSFCDLENSLFANNEENIGDLQESFKESLSANPKESQSPTNSNLNVRNSSLISETRKAKLASSDLGKILFTNEEEIPMERTTPILKSQSRKTKEDEKSKHQSIAILEYNENEEEILMEKTTPVLKSQSRKTKEDENSKDLSIATLEYNENFGDLAEETKEPSSLNLTPNKNCFNFSTFDTPKQNCLRRRKVLLRKSREPSSFLKNLRTSSESSLDLEKTMPSLTREKSQELELLKATQEILRISKNSSEMEKNSFCADSETPMDIYDLLSTNIFEKPSSSSYDAGSSSYFSPASLTSDDMNYTSLNCKQNLNNLFDTFNEQQLKPPTSQSPKTEEEHFEFYEPKEKLTKHHILQLIALYKEQPRLWDQSHPEFCDSQLSRLSWQNIADKWNEYCKRKFTIAEVRIRICTLCQRYLKERERLELKGELDQNYKFSYYEQMQFLAQQKSLQKRRELYDQQNEKVVEIYQHFPVLWHVGCYNLRQASERARAFQSISTALKLCGIQLSTLEVRKRIRSLRKFYRLEKIHYLHCQVDNTKFESSFRHFNRMQFLDKHIDPFVCRICGKIFENLISYREHLDAENHGSILEEDSESENENEFEENKKEFERMNDNNIELKDTFKTTPNELENQTPLVKETLATESPSYIETFLTSIPYTNEVTLATTSPIINEVLISPAHSTEQPISSSLQLDNQIIEEIMKNVTNDDSFTTKSLDNIISSVSNYEDITLNNYNNSEHLPPTLMDMEYPHLIVQNEIVIDQTMNIETPMYNHQTDMEVNMGNLNESQEFSKQNNQTDVVENRNTINENQELEKTLTENNSPAPIVVKVQCADYSLDLKLNTEKETDKIPACIDDLEIDTNEMDGIFARLPNDDIRKMIDLYRKYPQLWNPNHLDYNSRNLRRQAWCTLTAEYCKLLGRKFSWRTIHRKLMDYAKYYKKLITEQKDFGEMEIKWIFYKDFKFLDDVIAVHDELQRSVHHRDNNFKIIETYKQLPQLWDIKHPDFNKRPVKQGNIELMCYRLQEEYNLQITPERLKNRLIELRAQYRAAKKQRLKFLKTQQIYTPDFEFYEALLFIDPHIDPFICEQCNKEFKKLTDFNHHMRKEHEKKKVLRQKPLSLMDQKEGNDHLLENVCHICGIKFTTKSNLFHHIRRHDGIKNYECTLCTKKFFSSHSLKVHIRSHTKECPYTCEKCGASFVCASKLNQHVKRHTNKKDFQCDYCPKAFFTAFEMDRHVRRHLNIRDKICPICKKSFVAGSSYYAHMMLHNDTKRFECDKCDMKFAQYAGLYKHKKRHHYTVKI